MPTREDIQFSAAALRRRIVSQHQVHKAMRQVEKGERQAVHRAISDVMAARGYLLPEDRDTILGELGFEIVQCHECESSRLAAAKERGTPCPFCREAERARTPPAGERAKGKPEDEEPLVGQEIAPFRFLELIAHGGMASVYRGENMEKRRIVAIKVLQPELAEAEGRFVDRFAREGESAAAFEHPHIVRVYSAGALDDLHYIEMEYIRGHTLRRMIERLGRLTPAEAVAVAMPVLRALAFAHSQQVVHRDIKPDNIMITKTGRVKVADFGVAKHLNAATQFTRTGFVMGTPLYMSPEQCAGEPVDGRTDIYALGLTVYHAISGTCPHASDSALAVMHQRRSSPMPELHYECPDAPRNLCDVIARMTRVDPEERFPSAVDATIAFERVLTSGAVEKVSPRDLMERFHSHARRKQYPPTREAPRSEPSEDESGDAGPDGAAPSWPARHKRALLAAAILLAAIAGLALWLAR